MSELKSGAVGVVTLDGGRAEVKTELVTANSIIFLGPQDGLTTGSLFVSSRTPGEGFTITSTNGGDRGGVVGWKIEEPK